MSDVLSQAEIDALLNALTSDTPVETETQEEPENTEAVRIYDFRTANKFYKEQMRTLNMVFDTFAYLLSSKLTGLLHTVCNVDVISVEEQSFGEFNNSLPSPVILAVLEMEPLQGSILLEISSSLVYALISRLFGGPADYAQDKSFTEIEMSIMENVVHQMMGVLKEAWGKIVTVRPLVKRIESSSQFTQIVAMTEPTAIVTMSATIDNIDGIISFCIPHYSIQPIAKQMSAVNMALAEQTKPRKNDSMTSRTMEEQLQNTYVNVGVTFNATDALLGEILSMKPGDVIRLTHPITAPVNVNVEHLHKFKGVIGTDNHRYAVQIASVINAPEDKEKETQAIE